MKLFCIALISIIFSTMAYADSNWASGNGQIPKNAFLVGHDVNGQKLYLCQAEVILGGTQPGKTWGGYSNCNVPYGGAEKIQMMYSIYVGPHEGHWVDGQNGSIPERALVVGHEQNGNTLYLCRANYQNSVQPGKTWSGYNGCNIPFGGREVPVHDGYQVFVAGRHHHGIHFSDSKDGINININLGEHN